MHTFIEPRGAGAITAAVEELPTLWGSGTVRTFRPHWMLAELGVRYRSMPIGARTGETMTEEFRQLNPRHKIPVLVDGAFVVAESAAILDFLLVRYPDRNEIFRPSTAAERGRLMEWCFFVISEIDAHTLYLMRRHVSLAHIYGRADDAVRSARDYLGEQLEGTAARVGEAYPYLLGEKLSTADILFVSCLDWAEEFAVVIPGQIVAYAHRVRLRPAYAEARRRTFVPHPTNTIFERN